MPRAARISTEEGVFHVLARGNNNRSVFHDDDDYALYKKTLRRLKYEQPFQLYHYCLMGNHVHMIIETCGRTDLSKMMKRLNLIYYNHYRKKYGYSGNFWQERFKSLLIAKDSYLIACALYIERNPVRARLVPMPADYPHSSYRYYALGKEDTLIDRDPCYDALGPDDDTRRKEYRRLMLDRERRITSSTFKQFFLGSREFIERMETKYKLRNIGLKRGRPKKEK